MESQGLSQEPQSLQGGGTNTDPPKYGTLRTKLHMYYLKLTQPALQSIIDSVPEQIRGFLPPRANKDDLLSVVLRVRDEEAQAEVSPPESDQDKLDTLIRMYPAAIQNLTRENKDKLVDLMEASLKN